MWAEFWSEFSPNVLKIGLSGVLLTFFFLTMWIESANCGLFIPNENGKTVPNNSYCILHKLYFNWYYLFPCQKGEGTLIFWAMEINSKWYPYQIGQAIFFFLKQGFSFITSITRYVDKKGPVEIPRLLWSI